MTEYIIIGLLALVIILLVVLLLKKPPMQDNSALLSSIRNDTQAELHVIKQDLNASIQNSKSDITGLSEILQSNQKTSSDALLSQQKDFETSIGSKLDTVKSDINVQMKNIRDNNKSDYDRLSDSLSRSQKQSSETIEKQQKDFTESVNTKLDGMKSDINDQLETIRRNNNEQLTNVENRLESLEKKNEEKLEKIRSDLDGKMKELREENSKKLDEIRGTVDEKLQTTLEKRISESFKTVSERLEEVYKSMGEMQNLANDVGGLKKVLSGVKTRGIFGEIQLGAILEEILAPEQYDKNVVTVPGTRNPVEYAIKMPGENGNVYLPIDSKFPMDTFANLLEAQESADKERIDVAYKQLRNTIRSEAKDISEKYVSVPYTTNFAIMFLPTETLYAEVVSHGLIEELQKDFHINIAGPSTMAALLNSLQMGFRTLAIQKRSNDVWRVLNEVKTEFGKFDDALQKMQKHLNQTSDDLNSLLTTRTNQMNRKLNGVQLLEEHTDN